MSKESTFDFRWKQQIFLFSIVSRSFLWTNKLPIEWMQGAVSSVVKLPGREAEHSPPTSTEVKKMWICTSIPPYAYMA
jgi:hypothetical protein